MDRLLRADWLIFDLLTKRDHLDTRPKICISDLPMFLFTVAISQFGQIEARAFMKQYNSIENQSFVVPSMNHLHVSRKKYFILTTKGGS